MATIHELLDLIITTAQQLKGEAPTDVPAPTPTPAPSRFVDGKSAPDGLGRVELELIDRLIAEFGPAPAGYKIPTLWFVPGVDVSGLHPVAQGDYRMVVGAAAFNDCAAYSYKDETVRERGFLGKEKVITRRVPDAVIPRCLAWNGSLADLEAALRARIALLLNPNQSDPYKPQPTNGALDTVAGYTALQ